MPPTMIALDGLILLQHAVTETHPDMILPTIISKSNFMVTFYVPFETALIPIKLTSVTAPTEERIVFTAESIGMLVSLSLVTEYELPALKKSQSHQSMKHPPTIIDNDDGLKPSVYY